VEDDCITVFDAANPYETSQDTAYAHITNYDYIDGSGRHYIEINLKTSPGGDNFHLASSYDASEMGQDDPWLWAFDTGKAAGVCVSGSGFYTPDSSQLNRRDNTGAFDDAFL
jgi:hypothetical protein